MLNDVFYSYLSSEEGLSEIYTTAFPDKIRSVKIPCRVGFDRVILNVIVDHIDWDQVESVIKEETERARSTKERRTLSVYSVSEERVEKGDSEEETAANRKRLLLQLCEGSDRRYNGLIIRNHGDELRIKPCNLADRRDICTLELHIPPLQGHEILGNIHNMNCDEEKEWVLWNFQFYAERYGIYINPEVAELKEVEININAVMAVEKIIEKNGIGMKYQGMTDAVQILRPSRFALGKEFSHSDYSNEASYPLYISGIDKEDKLWKQKLDLNPQEKTYFSSTSKKYKLKCYNKSNETRDASNGLLKRVFPTMIRVEFEINKPKEIEKNFGNTNLFVLKQDDLNKAFSSMATELIKKPLKKYYHEMDIAFDKYFEKLDIVGHRSSWRKQVLEDLGNLVEETDGYLVIPYEDLRRYVKSINAPSIYKNCARITKELAKAFNDSQATGIRVTSEDIVELIVEWLTNPEEGPLQTITYELNE